MIPKCKTVEEWDEYGLLTEIPEDRKEMVVKCFNTSANWLIEGWSVTLERQGEFEILVLPLFYRIAKIIDLTEAEIVEICKEFWQAWMNFDSSEFVKLADPELHFVKSFAEMKIEQYKQK